MVLTLLTMFVVACANDAQEPASPTPDAPAPAAPAAPEPETPADTVEDAGEAELQTESVRVTTFFTGGDQWAPVWQEVIQEYMDANPHITIIDESLPAAGGNDLLRPRMHADVAAGTPVDVALFFNGIDASPLVESGMFVDWGPILDANPQWRDTFNPGALDAGYWDGQLVALPYIGFFLGLFYNERLFAENGLEMPYSWEAILEATEFFSQTDIIPMASTLLNPTSQLEMIILSQTGPAGRLNFFDPSWTPAIKMFRTLYELDAFPRDAATAPDSELRPSFADGRAAMSFNGSWTLNQFRENPDIRLTALAPMPGGNGQEGSIVAGFGSGWYMSQAAYERSTAALDFVMFMTSPEILGRFIAIGGSPAMPVELAPGTEPLMLSAMEMVANATSMIPPLDAQIPHEVFNRFNSELIFVAVGEIEPEAHLDTVRTLLAQFN